MSQLHAFIIPLLYCLLLGSAWGIFFKKKFADSLAPAIILHIIIVMLAGMLVHRLSVGIWGGILLLAGALAYKIWKEPQDARLPEIRVAGRTIHFLYFLCHEFLYYQRHALPELGRLFPLGHVHQGGAAAGPAVRGIAAPVLAQGLCAGSNAV